MTTGDTHVWSRLKKSFTALSVAFCGKAAQNQLQCIFKFGIFWLHLQLVIRLHHCPPSNVIIQWTRLGELKPGHSSFVMMLQQFDLVKLKT